MKRARPSFRQTRPFRQARLGFTLIELMLACSIAFIIVIAGASLAGMLARDVRRVEEQADLGTRAAIAHGFLTDLLASSAYNWQVTQTVGTVTRGSFGVGACASSTGMCASGTTAILPLEFCALTGLTASVCPAIVAGSSDALKTYVPRDALLDAVTISDRNSTALTTACDTANVPTPITFDVKGTNSEIWATNDLVVVARAGHMTFGIVKADFAVGGDASVTRQLALDVGGGANLAFDDGGNTTIACNAVSSLKGATVMRIRQVMVRLNATVGANTVEIAQRVQGTDPAAAFVPLISDVKDLQFQLDVVQIPATGSPSVCVANTTAVFNTTTLGAGPCNGKDLNSTETSQPILRVVGLRVGLVLQAAAETQNRTLSTRGLFDRDTVTIATDKRLHRTILVYVGLPNASSF